MSQDNGMDAGEPSWGELKAQLEQSQREAAAWKLAGEAMELSRNMYSHRLNAVVKDVTHIMAELASELRSHKAALAGLQAEKDSLASEFDDVSANAQALASILSNSNLADDPHVMSALNDVPTRRVSDG